MGVICLCVTKMRSLAGSLADGVLADAILILPCPPIPHTNIMKVKGSSKKYGNQKKKRGEMAKRFTTKYGNK